MKKRNFWAKCIAFLLVVVMVLSEQNITTLGETIGSYAQERMTGSSEQETERAIIKEDSSQESSSAAGSSSSSSETSTIQEPAKETTTQAVTVETTEETDTSQQINSSVQSSQTENEKITKGAEENSQQDQNKKKRAAEAQGEEEKSDAQKAKKAEKKIAKQVEKTKGMTYLEAAEYYYGDGGTMETASVAMWQNDAEKATVEVGETIYYTVRYKLTAAATYNYGEKNDPLFDTYDGTKIILHLPAGMIIDENLSTLRNVSEVTRSTDGGKNDWILELTNSILADSDTTGSIVVALKTGAMETNELTDTMPNGTVEVGHVYDFGEFTKETAPVEIKTSFTIVDRTGSSSDEPKTYNKVVPADEEESNINDLTAVTDDQWGISKVVNGEPVVNENKTTVTINYTLTVGLVNSEGNIISNPASYEEIGRTPFENGNTIQLKETPLVKDRSGAEITANSITVTPQFGNKTSVTYKAGETQQISVNTCGSYSSQDGDTLDTVSADAPYYSVYKVSVEYPYEKFIANYYDDNQDKLTVENEAKMTYQLKGWEKPKNASDKADVEAGEVTSPAKLTLTKKIFRYDAVSSADGVDYTSGNYPNGDPVSGAVTFKISKEDNTAPTLYTYDTESEKYSKIEYTDEATAGTVSYNPADGAGNVVVYLDPGTYTISEEGLPSHTVKVTATDNKDKNADNKTVAVSDTTVTFYNKEQLGKIIVEKTGQKTNETNIPLKDAIFGLYTDENCTEAFKVAQAATDNNGRIEFGRLPYGTYYVKEITAPTGYIKDNKVYTCEISAEKSSVTVESINNFNLAPVQLQKQIYDVEKKEYVNVNATNFNTFDGCFSIQKKNTEGQWVDVADYKDQSLNAQGQLNATLPVYEDDGTTLITYRFMEKLPNNWHADGETTLADGTRVVYTGGEEKEYFTLEGYLGNSSTNPYKVTLKNSRRGSIDLTKNFYQASASGMTVVSKENGTNLSATFKLYYEDKNGKLTEYKAGGQTQEYSVTAGQTISFNDLTLTDEKNEGIEYYLVETGIPEGYAASEKDAAGLGGINNAKKDTKEIDDKNQVVYGPFNFMDKIGEGESAEIRLDQSATINNVEQKVPVIVEKEDSYTGKHVAGTKYTISRATDGATTGSGTPVVSETEIPENGSFQKLDPGYNYKVTETDWPANYHYDETIVDKKTTNNIDLSSKSVDIDTKPTEVVIKNEPDPTFNLTKYIDDATTADKTLSGVTFEIYTKNDGTDNTFTKVKDYDESELTFTPGTPVQVPAGTYYLKETNAADKGVLDPSKHADLYAGKGVTDSSGNFYFGPYTVKQQKEVNTLDDIINYSDKGAVTVTKYRMKVKDNSSTESPEDRKIPLDGAVLGIFKKGEDNPLQTGKSAEGTGIVTFSGLKIYNDNGQKIKYEIREISAPAGYTKSDEVLEVELQAGTTVTTGTDNQALELINQPVTSLTVEKTYYNVWEHAFTNKAYLLPGTVIALYKLSEDGSTYNWVETQTTNDQGLVTFENLTQKDEYVAVEVAVPEGEDFQYLEPKSESSGAKKEYLGYEANGKPKDKIPVADINKYAYVKKAANVDSDGNLDIYNPQGAQTGDLVNVENWAQLHIEKYVLRGELNGGTVEDKEENKTPIHNAQFTLYMEVLDKDTQPNEELAFNQNDLSNYEVIGTYSSGTLYDENGNRKDGWFGTDILKAADNVVYWLVETDAGIGAKIRPENVVTLIKRENTGYTNKTTYKYKDTVNGIEQEITAKPEAVMIYKDNQVTEEHFKNAPTKGSGTAMFSTVRIAKWAGKRTENGDKEYSYSSLGNATFDLYLADSDGNLYTKLDTMTTGLDNKVGSTEAASQALSGWASSRAFSWKEMTDIYKAGVPEKVRDYIFTKDDDGNGYVRVAIKESGAPTGYQMDKDVYYMYMYFQKDNSKTTQIYNDAYYVKGNGAEGSADADVELAENQNGITWALYPTVETSSGYELCRGINVTDSSKEQYRLVNWPVDTQAVTVRTYGYEVQKDNIGKTSEELDEYYASGAHDDRESIKVTMRLERYEEDQNGTGKWVAYAYDKDHTNGVFSTSGGYFAFPNGLAMGRYRIVETSVPAEYENIYNNTALTGGSEGQDKAAYYFQVSRDNVHLTMYNPAKLSLSLKKTDVDSNEAGEQTTPLKDVTFRLTDTKNTTNKREATTGQDGKATINQISSGTYKLTETFVKDSDTDKGYTTEYFRKYFEETYNDKKYDNTNGTGNLNDLVNGNGISLGYNTAQKSGDNGTSVVVSKKTDITNYGIKTEDEIDLHIENPEKISFTITKKDADNNSLLLGGATFKVEYLPFEKVSGDITVDNTTAQWQTLSPVTTALSGENKGKVTVSGSPGIYRITETAAPTGYDLTDTTPKYIAMTGGLNIGNVILKAGSSQTGITKNSDTHMVFKDEKQVSLQITKTIKKGSMTITGDNTFTFALYEKVGDQMQPVKINGTDVTLTLTSNNGGDVSGKVAGLSQGKTYYLKETTVGTGFAFTAINDSNGEPINAENGYYPVTMPIQPVAMSDEDADMSVTAVNTYLYGEASIRKVNGETGEALHDAEFTVKRVTKDQEDKDVLEDVDASFKEEGESGIYTAIIPLTGTAEETFRVYEETAPKDYLLDETHYIEFTLSPGQKLSDPVQWDKETHAASQDVEINNTAMRADRIFPNYCGAYVDLTKYDDIHVVKDTSAEPQNGAGFTLYRYDETALKWVEAATGITGTTGVETETGADGKIHFVVDGGSKYALKETTVPQDYLGLEGIYTDPDDQKVTTDANDSQLYVLNNGNPIEAGQTYMYKAYDIPKLPLEIQKHNVLDKDKALTATAALYEVPDGVLTEDSTDEDVSNFLNGGDSGQKPAAIISNISVSKERKENGETYTYADSGSLGTALTAGKTYLVLETNASVSQIRDNEQVEWYDVFTVSANASKDYKQTAHLRNVTGDAELSLAKTVDKNSYTSLFTEEAEVEYTITPIVEDNTYPLNDFTVTDEGLTAYSGRTELSYETYLKGKYSLKEVTVGKAEHDTDDYASGSNYPIYATVTFYDSDGKEIYKTAQPLNVSAGEQTAALPVNVTEKAAKVSISYQSDVLKTETGYALGANFKPGAIKIMAVIDQQEGGADKSEISSIINTASATLHYNTWGGDGKKAQKPTQKEAKAQIPIQFEGQKGAKITVNKSVVGGDTTVNLQDVVEYSVVISNAADAEAAMVSPYIVDYLPQGTSLEEYDDNNVVKLEAGNTNLTYNQEQSSIQAKNGENAVIIAMNGELKPGESVTVKLKVKINNTVTTYGSSIDNYVLVGSDNKGVVSAGNKQAASFKNANDDWAQSVSTVLGNAIDNDRMNALIAMLGSRASDGFVSGSVSIDWAAATDMALVKSAYGDGNPEDGYRTDILSVVENGGDIHYRLSISNIAETNGAKGFSVIDILPNTNDVTSADAARESQWRLNFGAIDNVYINVDGETGSTGTTAGPVSEDKYQVYYYTGELSDTDPYGALYDQVSQINFDTSTPPAGWTKTPGTTKEDKEKIKAFIVAIDDFVKLEGNASLVIDYTAQVNGGKDWDPATLNNNSWKNAVNSFSCTCTQYTLSNPGHTWSSGVLGSNLVSATIYPEKVKVGGNIWIDKNNDGVQDTGESIDNFKENTLIQDMLDNLGISLSTFSGTSSLPSTTPFNRTNATWETEAEFVFADLYPAMLKENTADNKAYPNGILNPEELKGTDPSTYTINVTLPQDGGKFKFADVKNSVRRSYKPGEIPLKQQTDSNFVKNSANSKQATSERFYLWATDPSIYDNTKDVGLVPYRDLVITKKTEDGRPIQGVTFKVYGPFANTTVDASQLNEDNLVGTYTTENGSVTVPDLLWYQNYVIVENDAPVGYELDVDSASATSEETTSFTPVEDGIDGKPAWVLGVPDDKAQDAVDTVAITNKRTATNATLKVSKEYLVNGKAASIPANKFTVTLWKGDPRSEQAQSLSTKTIGATGTVEFTKDDTSELSFTSPGNDNVFYITETLPVVNGKEQNPSQGITYDTALYKATVNVTWTDGVGLSNTVTYEKLDADSQWVALESSGEVKFTNTYTAIGSWTPEGTKTLTGRDMKDGETYTFSVREVTTGDGQNTGDDTAAGETTVPADSTGSVTGGSDGQPSNIIFTPINYTLDDVGTHTYIIVEDKAGQNIAGVTYDNTSYTVTVKVEDKEQNGELTVTSTYKKGDDTVTKADFTNNYVPTSTTYVPEVKKTLTGHKLPDGTKKFTFILSAVSNNAREVLPTDKNIEISFAEGEAKAKTQTFEQLTFIEGGTYTFKITEQSGTPNDGYTYDKAEWTLTVVVTDDLNGTLSIDTATGITYDKNEDGTADSTAAEFTNDYTPASTTTQLEVSKEVEGAPMAKDATFTFTQSLVNAPVDGVAMPGNDTVEITVVPENADNADANKAQFDPITFTKAGIYEFHITEETNTLPDGYDKNISNIKLVEVTVEDVGGELKVTGTKYYTSTDSTGVTTGNAAFTNRYNTVDTVFTPEIKKILTGDVPTGKKTFTFTLTRGDSKDGVQMPGTDPDADSITTSVTYDSNIGDIIGQFGQITFTKAGTYTFDITEVAGETDDGYTYDGSTWTLTVKVEDQNSKLKVTEHKYTKAGSPDSTSTEYATFTNTYDLIPTDFAPKVTKTIEGAAVPDDIEATFTFVLTNVGKTDGVDLGRDESKELKVSTKDMENGSINAEFADRLHFTKAGTYTFQIAETAGSQNGYTYDDSIWNLTVTVEDKGGYLKVTDKTYAKANVAAGQDNGENEDHATFTNTYSVTPDTFTPQVEKQFSDDSVTRPTAKDFTFKLTADEQNPAGGAFTGYDETTGSGTALEGANTIETKVNGSGTGAFDTITFTKAGTYKFRIKEEAGSDLGYTYDDAVWTLTVQVDDIGGALQVTNNDVTYQSNDTTVEPNNEKAVFVNEYHYISSIIINKEVLRGNAEYETDDVFYAGIFRKVDNTGDGTGGETGNISYEIVKNVVVDNQTVESGVVQLANNDSVEVYVPLGGEDQTEAITYYVFETDAEGHLLVSFDEDGNAVYNQPFAYEISSESTGEDGTVNGRGEVYVTPDTVGAHPEVTITNRATSVSIEKRDISGNPLTGAVLELWKQADSVDAGVAADEDRTKAANGDILLETWTSDGTPHELTAELAVGGTYYLREAEVPAGYVQAADILFTVENGDPITLVMEDENQAGVLGQIQVTKRLSAIDETTFDNIDLVAEDATVYVGLFTDAQGEHPYGEDYVKEIHIQDASSGTVTFDNLPSGTYYVFETQQDGTVIPYGELQADAAGSGAGFICAGDGSNGGVKEITLNPDTGAPEGSTELGNVYYGDLPDGFAYQGELMITKAVMKDGAPADSSDTFYAGIFTSETETTPYKVVALENNRTVTVEVPLGGENGMDPVTYYIYETDADGNKIDKNSFAYTVSGEGTVDLDVDNTTAGRTIINTMASDSDTTRTIREKNDSDTKKISTDTSKKSTGTNRRTSSSKTGDDTRVGLYLLFFAAAAVGIILTLRKRKEDKPE